MFLCTFDKVRERVRVHVFACRLKQSQVQNRLRAWDNRVKLTAINKKSKELEKERERIEMKETKTRQDMFTEALAEVEQARKERRRQEIVERHKLDSSMLERRHVTPGPGNYAIPATLNNTGVTPFG